MLTMEQMMEAKSVETIQGIDFKPLTLYIPIGSKQGIYQDLGYDCIYEYEPEDTDEIAAVINAFDYEQIRITLPDPIPMWGMGPRLKQVDMPRSEPSAWPVMSTDMLDVLRSLGDFPHVARRTEIFDMDLGNAPTPEQIAAPPPVFENFVILHITQHLRAIDYRRSEYRYYHYFEDGERERRHQPDAADTTELEMLEQGERRVSPSKLVLTLREDELPPVFRLKSWSTSLFIPPVTYERIERERLQNVAYLKETVYVPL